MDIDRRAKINDEVFSLTEAVKNLLEGIEETELSELNRDNKITRLFSKLKICIDELMEDTFLKPDSDVSSALDSIMTLVSVYGVLMGRDYKKKLEKNKALELKEIFEQVAIFTELSDVRQLRDFLYQPLQDRLYTLAGQLTQMPLAKLALEINKFRSCNDQGPIVWQELRDKTISNRHN